jgi:hypothetical protein
MQNKRLGEQVEENERYLSEYLRQKEEVLRERAQRLMQINKLRPICKRGKENSFKQNVRA